MVQKLTLDHASDHALLLSFVGAWAWHCNNKFKFALRVGRNGQEHYCLPAISWTCRKVTDWTMNQTDLNFHVTIMKTRREITYCCCSRESVTKARTEQELRKEHERAVM
jgi:hypothetical protein